MKKNIFVIFIISVLFLATGCEGDTERLSGYAVHGIDISRHQSKVNWDAVAAEGISFAFVKATEGRRHSDTFYCRNWAEMQRVGIKRGAYHFFRPSIDAKEQANNFIATVDMQYGDLPPVIDVEVDEDVPREELAKQLKMWLYLVELKYSIRPIIYTSYKFYNKFIAGEFDKYPIWIAKYGGEAPRLGGQARWWFWQYGNKGRVKGIDGYVDLNVFYDSREELDKICLSGAMLSGIDRQYWLEKQSKF
jgi:lysozyme